MRRSALTIVAAPMVLAASAHAQVGVIYEQPPATSEGNVSGGYYSNLLSDTFLYDDFTLGADALLDELQLWGFGIMYDSSIVITLYEGGGPEGVGPAVASRTFSEDDIDVVVTDGWVEDVHIWWPEEHATLPIDPPIRLEAGREYWIGVAGETDLVWSFRALDGDLSILYSDASQQDFWDQNDTDMAFRLVGRPASPADLAEPYASLDFNDVVAFLFAFVSGDLSADLAAPIGVLNFVDVAAFLQAFATGLP
ncbi:MAG: GC-type dockerin domain-anchored protein [Phycisphaerales bacterium]